MYEIYANEIFLFLLKPEFPECLLIYCSPIFLLFIQQTVAECSVMGTVQGAEGHSEQDRAFILQLSFCMCGFLLCHIQSVLCYLFFYSPFSHLLCFRSINYFKSISSFQDSSPNLNIISIVVFILVHRNLEIPLKNFTYKTKDTFKYKNRARYEKSLLQSSLQLPPKYHTHKWMKVFISYMFANSYSF